MMIILPKWLMEVDEKIQKVVDDAIREHGIDWFIAHDSKSLNEMIYGISHKLWNLSAYKTEIDWQLREEHAKLEKALKAEGKKFPMKIGRPTVITPEIGKFILENRGMPSRRIANIIHEKFNTNKINCNTVCNYIKKSAKSHKEQNVNMLGEEA